jgi:NIMA (never in mitosis gene a)-related kinase
MMSRQPESAASLPAQVYAMKETDLGKMGQQERADAVNEIRLLGSLSHPNVVRHHETFLAGEWAAG